MTKAFGCVLAQYNGSRSARGVVNRREVIPTTGEKRGFWYKYVTIGCSQHGSNRIRESGRYGADKSCHSYFDQSSEDERERPKM